MAWYKVHVESVTRGFVYVEAPDTVTAGQIVENAPLETAFKNQVLHEAIQEKITFTPLSFEELIEGQDYVEN